MLSRLIHFLSSIVTQNEHYFTQVGTKINVKMFFYTSVLCDFNASHGVNSNCFRSRILTKTFLDTISMERPTMHLAFADSEARNLARVDVMNQGCRLDTANRANLNFETLRELQYNSTNHLDIESNFLKNEDHDQDIKIQDLKQTELIDLFKIQKESGKKVILEF